MFLRGSSSPDKLLLFSPALQPKLGPAFLRLLNRYVPFLHQLLGGIMLPGSNGSPYGHHNQLQLAVKVSGALAGPLKRRQGPGRQASRATRSSSAWPAAAWATSTRAPPGRRRRADPLRTTRCCWAWSWRGRRSGAAMRGTCALAFGATVFKAELRERCETFHRVCPRSFEFFLQILRCSCIRFSLSFLRLGLETPGFWRRAATRSSLKPSEQPKETSSGRWAIVEVVGF